MDKEQIFEMTIRELTENALETRRDVMNVKQVSVILGVSTKTVYKQIKDGNLQCIKVGREFRIPKVILLNYIKVFGSIES